MTFDRYCIAWGVSAHPPDFPQYHSPSGWVSKRSKRAADKRVSTALHDWSAARDRLREEYNRLDPEYAAKRIEAAKKKKRLQVAHIREMAQLCGPRDRRKLLAEAEEIEQSI